MRKIALEEYFITPDFLKATQETDFISMNPKDAARFQAELLDFDSLRIDAMDQAGIEISVLSLTDPGVQGIRDAKEAAQKASRANDFLAEKVAKHPSRYRGFAALAMQDPVQAAKELERCVREYQFVGGLINGQTGGVYLDEKQNLPFWETVDQLNVPIYLHPGSPEAVPPNYKGLPELAGPVWGWTVETGTHALRLVFSGLLDRFPNLNIILGHMGETLPYLLWRLDSRWAITKQPISLKRAPSAYLKENFYVTTSGMCANGPLRCALEEMGEDRVMFSVDYPYESSSVAAKFIESAPVSREVLEKICFKNAERILPL